MNETRDRRYADTIADIERTARIMRWAYVLAGIALIGVTICVAWTL